MRRVPLNQSCRYSSCLRLPAKHAEIRGGEITYEQPFENIGYWHDEDDRASWRVSLSKEQL